MPPSVHGWEYLWLKIGNKGVFLGSYPDFFCCLTIECSLMRHNPLSFISGCSTKNLEVPFWSKNLAERAREDAKERGGWESTILLVVCHRVCTCVCFLPPSLPTPLFQLSRDVLQLLHLVIFLDLGKRKQISIQLVLLITSFFLRDWQWASSASSLALFVPHAFY